MHASKRLEHAERIWPNGQVGRAGTWGEGDTAASRCWLKAENPVDTAAAGGALEAAGVGGWDASERARWMTVVCCGCSGCCACHMPSTCKHDRQPFMSATAAVI
jgi:hypothetical protein